MAKTESILKLNNLTNRLVAASLVILSSNIFIWFMVTHFYYVYDNFSNLFLALFMAIRKAVTWDQCLL